MEIGEYCRDIYSGEIVQIEDIWLDDDRIGIKFKEYAGSNTFSKEQLKEIFKHSKNIIDLIQKGDYINGCLIVEIDKDPFIKGQTNLWTNMILSEGEPFPNEYYKAKIIEKDIKSIVTKEQFKGSEYIVEE